MWNSKMFHKHSRYPDKWGPPFGQDDWAVICTALNPCIDADEWRDTHETLRGVATESGIEKVEQRVAGLQKSCILSCVQACKNQLRSVGRASHAPPSSPNPSYIVLEGPCNLIPVDVDILPCSAALHGSRHSRSCPSSRHIFFCTEASW